MSDLESQKYAAAARALEFVEPGMKLGLGTGSTARAFVELLGVRGRDGLDVVCTPTSEATAQLARSLGLTLAPLDDLAPLDLAIDGADEVDAELNLIKGGGASHTREKIVEASAKRLIIIADETKQVEQLGRFPLPVEVVQFGHRTSAARIAAAAAALGYRDLPLTLRRKDGAPLITDNGNLIYDCAFGAIADCRALAAALAEIVGVVEHGLFIGMAEALVLARADGVEILKPKSRRPQSR
jgi:ribose 5-phosphate isomerase A